MFLRGSDFKIFSNLIEKNFKVKGIVVDGTANKPRSFFDKLNNWAREEGAAGLGYISFAENEHKGPIAKNLDAKIDLIYLILKIINLFFSFVINIKMHNYFQVKFAINYVKI